MTTDADLADLLRDASLALLTTESSGPAREAARANLEAAVASLTGDTKRRRWYEIAADTPDGAEQRRHAARTRELSPISGELNVVAPPLRIERGELDGTTPCLIAEVTLDARWEGPPRSVHGGVMAALFDELLGAAQRLGPGAGVTARLAVRYRAPTPVGEPLRFEAWVEHRHRRRTLMKARCVVAGKVTAEASGTFVPVDFEAFERRRRDGQE